MGIPVSMPSWAWVVTGNSTDTYRAVSFQCPHGLELLLGMIARIIGTILFQCPLGLIPHFYDSLRDAGRRPRSKSVNALSGLYLISTSRRRWKSKEHLSDGVNALSGLYLISTDHMAVTALDIKDVSMPSRAYTSFLRYPFKNLGFMRFPEPVFADTYQNILTIAIFRAC